MPGAGVLHVSEGLEEAAFGRGNVSGKAASVVKS
jgi:hypothetical protein